ncbi:MAG TPA: hypothetical protein VKV23_05900 [Acidimicrobiales bacterium]|nr:hypothetical protein [Acidimicrobiales bacterium]
MALPALDPATPPARLRRLAGVLVDLSRPEPFGLYLARHDDPLSQFARYVEQRVFYETFGDSPELLAAEYGPYEASSIFFFVLDHRRGLPVGMTRIIVPSEAGLKTANDLEPWWGVSYRTTCERSGIPCLPEATWDVATLAVTPEYRGSLTVGLVSAALYQSLSMTALRCRCEWYLAILHASVLRMLQWRMRRPFAYFAGIEAQSYLGSSQSLPVYGHLPTWHARLAAEDPHLHSMMCEGRGLEAEVRAPDWDEAAASVEAILPRPRELVLVAG